MCTFYDTSDMTSLSNLHFKSVFSKWDSFFNFQISRYVHFLRYIWHDVIIKPRFQDHFCKWDSFFNFQISRKVHFLRYIWHDVIIKPPFQERFCKWDSFFNFLISRYLYFFTIHMTWRHYQTSISRAFLQMR